MQRSLLMIALMVLAAVPAATAHDPPGPVLTCQTIGSDRYHDYLPPNTGNLVLGGDGNLNDCPKPNPIEVGLGLCLDPETSDIPVVCDPVSTGVDQPGADYDGELDYGHGGVFLFYVTGDGQTSGVTACFGWPSVGHHAGGIYALDVSGNGPQFSVTSDYSRPGLEENPDCGDNYVEPCDPLPPAPSDAPFPVNVVLDTLSATLYTIFGPGGEGCNDLDCARRADSVLGAPSHLLNPCPPGADGALVVFIEQDYDTPVLATAGHVWTN